ncbi:MAG: Lrp/AsnC family transcriptional regulator [Actinomycetia bacterium]|nr:Lrp/AsnC family transcriptional regulator [Actinomycetes bacterium]
MARPSATRPAANPEPDEINKAIIRQLQDDGRRPYAAIGKAVGLSEAAVRQRVQKLIDNGVIQIVAVTDPMQLGFARQVMIGIQADRDLVKVADALGAIPEVDYVVIVAGPYDVIIEAVVTDDAHLLDLLSEIRSIDGVDRTETFLYLKLAKQTYNWGAK